MVACWLVAEACCGCRERDECRRISPSRHGRDCFRAFFRRERYELRRISLSWHGRDCFRAFSRCERNGGTVLSRSRAEAHLRDGENCGNTALLLLWRKGDIAETGAFAFRGGQVLCGGSTLSKCAVRQPYGAAHLASVHGGGTGAAVPCTHRCRNGEEWPFGALCVRRNALLPALSCTLRSRRDGLARGEGIWLPRRGDMAAAARETVAAAFPPRLP